MKKLLVLGIVLAFSILLVGLVYAQEANETQTPQTPTIKCYSSKDCSVTQQVWCDGVSACQKLAQCLNPGTPQSECSVVDECVNCINIGYLGCKDGQCQKINCYKDSDCGESNSKKYCSGAQACISENIFYCSNPGTIDSACTSKGGIGCTLCNYGCSEGVCLQGTNQTYPCGQGKDGTQCPCASVPAAKTGCIFYQVYGANGCLIGYKESCETTICKDTDGGINYYVKGNVMFGDKIAATDSCEDKVTLREESCVPNPGPNEGTMLTSVYKCPNGCSNGACIKGEKQKEEVKCIFKNTKAEQKCYMAGKEEVHCSGVQTCIVTNLEGYDGEKITWKSSCGGYTYTTLDGNNEYAEFDCGAGETNITEISKNGFKHAYFQCYDGEESSSTGREACKSAEFWQKFSEQFCESHCKKYEKEGIEKCGVNTFSIGDNCYLDEEPTVEESITDCSLLNCLNAYYDYDLKECKCGAISQESLEPTLVCQNSCPLNEKCYPFGYRKAGEYCSDEGKFVEQLGEENCDNNFECKSNVCVDGKCVSGSLIQKIIEWFKNLFG